MCNECLINNLFAVDPQYLIIFIIFCFIYYDICDNYKLPLIDFSSY